MALLVSKAEHTSRGTTDSVEPAVVNWNGARSGPVKATSNEPPAETPREWLFPGADEWFRTIYTRAGAGTPEVLMISSAISGEGKTTLGIGLAVTLAEDFPDRRLILVEADVEHKVLADDFEVADAPGLLECLVNGEAVWSACRGTALHNLDILPAGGAVAYSGRALRTSRMAALVDALRDSYDIVIVDTPGLLVNSDSQLLSDLADGVIFVVRAGVTPTHLVNKALEQIDESKLRGIVLNATRSSIPNWIQRVFGT